jgi:hypothetical protein
VLFGDINLKRKMEAKNGLARDAVLPKSIAKNVKERAGFMIIKTETHAISAMGKARVRAPILVLVSERCAVRVHIAQAIQTPADIAAGQDAVIGGGAKPVREGAGF